MEKSTQPMLLDCNEDLVKTESDHKQVLDQEELLADRPTEAPEPASRGELNAFLCAAIWRILRRLNCNPLYNTDNTCTEASQFMSTTAPVSESRPPKGGRVIPGWSQEVDNLKQQALFWHRQWRSRGRPHNGDITERRRITRARYH